MFLKTAIKIYLYLFPEKSKLLENHPEFYPPPVGCHWLRTILYNGLALHDPVIIRMNDALSTYRFYIVEAGGERRKLSDRTF